MSGHAGLDGYKLRRSSPPTPGARRVGSVTDPFGSSALSVSRLAGSKAGAGPAASAGASGADRFRQLQLKLALIAKQHEAKPDALLAFRDGFKAWAASLPGAAASAAARWDDLSMRDIQRAPWAPQLGELLDFSLRHGLVQALDVVHAYVPLCALRWAQGAPKEGSALPEPRNLLTDGLLLYNESSPGFSLYTQVDLVRLLTSHGWPNQHTDSGLAAVCAANVQHWMAVHGFVGIDRVEVLPEMAYYARLQKALKEPLEHLAELLPAELEGLVRLPFQKVGHKGVAYALVTECVLHFGFGQEGGARPLDCSRPLVLLMGGPSGHGKTLMAQQLAALVAPEPLDRSNFCKIACGSAQSATELFGLSGAYQGAGKHTQLNEFVVQCKQRYGVVLLDEFEKLRPCAMEGFLEAWDTGKWVDKRLDPLAATQTRSGIDCSKLIFVLTTNLRFRAGASPDEVVDALPFPPELKGRITAALQFSPFESSEDDVVENERLLIVHHYLLQACRKFMYGHGMPGKVWGNLQGRLLHKSVGYETDGPLAPFVLGTCTLLDALGVREVERKVSRHLGRAALELYGQLGECSGPDPARMRFGVVEGEGGQAMVVAGAQEPDTDEEE